MFHFIDRETFEKKIFCSVPVIYKHTQFVSVLLDFNPKYIVCLVVFSLLRKPFKTFFEWS